MPVLLRALGRAATVVAAAAVVLVVGGPLLGLYRTSVVLSGSMEPALPVGALVVTVPVPAEQVRPGQVVALRLPDGRTRTHRVTTVERDAGGIVLATAGDANPSADPERLRPVGARVWVAERAVPHVGHVLLALRSGPVRLLLGLALPAALGAAHLHRIWTERPPRHLARRPRRSRPTPAAAASVALLALVAAVAGPGVVGATFSSTHVVDTAPVRAATLATPTGVSATGSCLLLGLLDPNIEVRWDAAAPPVTGHRVERLVSGSWTTVATVGAGATSWVDRPVALGATRTYRVRTLGGSWWSPPSSQVSATVPLLCL